MGIKVITTLKSAPLSSYDLVTLAVVKDELDIKDNARDATLKRYITAASAAAVQYCDRIFQAETLQDEFWPAREAASWQLPNEIDMLQFSRWPVASISSLTENGVTLVENTDFRTDAVAGRLIRLDANLYPCRWSAWPIVALYVGGFAVIPADVADAVVRMVTRRVASKGRDPNLRQQNIPGVLEQSWWIATGTQAGSLSPDIADILDNYRVPRIA